MAGIEKLPAGVCTAQRLFTEAALARTIGAPISGKAFECSFANAGGEACGAVGVLNDELHSVKADADGNPTTEDLACLDLDGMVINGDAALQAVLDIFRQTE